MTESSLPWSGTSIGDHGAYSDGQWSDIWRKLYTQDRSVEGVLAGYTSELAVSNPSSLLLRAGTGAALVDGKFYENDEHVDFTLALPGGGKNRYDRVVLRKDWAAQTVRAAILTGAEAASPSVPALTQISGETWEIPLAKAYITEAGAITLTDERAFCRFATPLLERRQGGSAADWSAPGSTGYAPGAGVSIQAGAATISLSSQVYKQSTITFPAAFADKPLVLATITDPNQTSEDMLGRIDLVFASYFTYTLQHLGGAALTGSWVLNWLAIGAK